ncbi:MAG: MarC family protein [Candidatus Omnitrophica bacterium]|nr:MarC family protein [Candidatus Omnitrophota bacterium]
MLKNFWLAFIPLFVAVDAVGVLPVFVSLTESLSKKERLLVVWRSLLTATGLAIGFIFLGKAVFHILNITIADFMVAGGLLLFAIAIIDILNPTKNKGKAGVDEMGFVPLGTPLIVGPAVLTTSLLMLDVHGIAVTLVAVLVNIVLAGAVLLSADSIIKILGISGTRALSKVISLLLAAIAVMMIRKGVTAMINM